MTSESVEPTQADRDAASSYLFDVKGYDVGSAIRQGRSDHTVTVQAFARHRIEAERSARLASTQEPATGEEKARELLHSACAQWNVTPSPGHMLLAPFCEEAMPWLVAKTAVQMALRTPASPK